jgi:hypothetical protein
MKYMVKWYDKENNAHEKKVSISKQGNICNFAREIANLCVGLNNLRYVDSIEKIKK